MGWGKEGSAGVVVEDSNMRGMFPGGQQRFWGGWVNWCLRDTRPWDQSKGWHPVDRIENTELEDRSILEGNDYGVKFRGKEFIKSVLGRLDPGET